MQPGFQYSGVASLVVDPGFQFDAVFPQTTKNTHTNILSPCLVTIKNGFKAKLLQNSPNVAANKENLLIENIQAIVLQR